MKKRAKRGLAGVLAVLMLVWAVPFNGLDGMFSVKAEEAVYTLAPATADAATIVADKSENMGGNSSNSGYFTLKATTSDIIIEAKSKTAVDKTKFDCRIKMQKTGSKSDQNISFTTTKQYAKVTVYAMSGTSTDSTRGWTLADSNGKVIDANCVDGSSLYSYTYYVSNAGTYYMYSDNSGINVYGITVEETDTKPVLGKPVVSAVPSGSTAVISWNKIAGASAYEVYSSADDFAAPIETVSVSDPKQAAYETSVNVTVSGEYTYAVKAVNTAAYTGSEAGKSDKIKIDANASQVESLDTADWAIAKLGTGSDKMADPVYKAATNTLSLSTGGNGKMANTGQVGFEMYYTKIKSSDYNFTLRGRFNVTEISKVDNQSSFGLTVVDSLGNQDATTDYVNQLNLYAATKSEVTSTCIPGIRLYTGNSDTTGQKNASGTCDVTQYFDANATIFNSDNATSLYYNFELVKNSNGYVCNWYNDDWTEIVGTKSVYNPAKFLQQDSENIYVGFYAARIGKVEVTDISYEKHEPTAEEIAAIDKDLWIDYDTVNIKTFAGETTSSADYNYRFKSNVTGTLSVKDSLGNVYVSDKEIADGDTVEFNISEKKVELPVGTTTFTTEVTPYTNSVDDDGKIVYEDRLLLKDYSTRTVENTVTRASIGVENGTLYVSSDGTVTGAGTRISPLDLNTALSYAAAGQTIILMDGTYKPTSVLAIPYSVSGTKESPITLKAEHTGKAIINGSALPNSSDSVLFIKGNYWNIYGLVVCYSSDGTKGIHVAGNYNKVEMCEMYRNGSTGLQISYSGGEPSCWWPAHNTILNCTSHDNCDSKQNDADGFAAKLSVGAENVFDGCIAYNHADDGYDLYAKDKAGYGPIEAVTIQNSLAYNNGTLVSESGVTSYSAASANGFKLGGEGLTGKHVLRNCVSWNNGGSGIMSNNGPDCQVYNCISVDNGLFSRVGKTEGRNNYQLTPKNGDKYLYTTGYIVQNSIGFYTDAITDVGTMEVDKFTLKGQDASEIFTENNYLCKNISTKVCSNSKDAAVTANWFKSVDYKNITPVRNEDGSIDMKGLFVLTSIAPSGVGALINKADAVEPTQPVEKPTTQPEETTTQAETTKPVETTTQAEITKPVETTTQVETTKPVQTTTQAETTKPVETTTQVETTKPAETTTAAEATKPAGCTEHSWDEGVVTKNASYSETGIRTYTCKVCGETKTEVIPAIKEAVNVDQASGSSVKVDEELLNGVLTAEEKAAAAAGAEVKISLQVQDINETVSEADQVLISEALGQNSVGLYLDIKMSKQIGTAAPSAITEATTGVEIKVLLPESLKNTNIENKRTYKIVRVHDGVAELIECSYDAASNVITFVTDRFSTYAVVYSDTSIADQAQNNSADDSTAANIDDSAAANADNSTLAENSANDSNDGAQNSADGVQGGDHTPVKSVMIMLLASGIVICAVLRRRKSLKIR